MKVGIGEGPKGVGIVRGEKFRKSEISKFRISYNDI